MISQETFNQLDLVWRILVWIGLAAGIVLLLRSERPPSTSENRRAIALASGVFLGALVIRIVLPPWTPLHDNNHGIAEIRTFLSEDTAAEYGAGYPQLMHCVTRLFGRTAPVVFAFTAVCGALGCAVLFLVVRALTRSPTGGLIAAVGFALHPAFVRLSSSESPWPAALLLFLAGVGAGCVALDPSTPPRRAQACRWIFACAIALSSELTVATTVLPLDALLLVWASRPPGPWHLRAWKPFGLSLGLIGVTVTFHLIALSFDAAPSIMMHAAFAGLPPADADLLRMPGWSPLWLLPCAAFGAVFAGNGRLRAAALISGLSIYLPAATVGACTTDLLRYQTPAHVFLYILAAGGAARLFAALKGTRVAAAAITAVMLGGWLWGDVAAIPSLKARTVDDAAFELVEQAAGVLPKSVRIAAAEGNLSAGTADRGDVSVFPKYLLERDGRTVDMLSADELARLKNAAEGPSCFVYLAPACYRFDPKATAETLARSPHLEGGPVLADCEPLLERADIGSSKAVARHLTEPAGIRDFIPLASPSPLVGFFPCTAGRDTAAVPEQ